MAVLGSISYLGQLQDPSQCPLHIPQLSTAQPLPILQLVQVLQAPLATLPARLCQPCREHSLVPALAGQGGPSSQPCPPSSSSSPQPQLSTSSIWQMPSRRLQMSNVAQGRTLEGREFLEGEHGECAVLGKICP